MLPTHLAPQLINERLLLDNYNIKPDDCIRTIKALHSTNLAPQGILDFVTSSDSVLRFIENERDEFQSLIGKSQYRLKVVVGGCRWLWGRKNAH